MFKKLLLTVCLFFSFTNTGSCFSENNIADIEYAKYGQSFDNESLASRLGRLETDFFGAQQTGDLDSRLNKLTAMSSNIIPSPMNTFNDDYYPGQKKGVFKNFLDNVSSAFSDMGTMTGFTPSLYSGSYNPYYNNGFTSFTNGYSNYCPYQNRYIYPNNFYNRLNRTRYPGLSNNFYRPPYYNNRRITYHNHYNNIHRPGYNNSALSYYSRPYNSITSPIYPQNVATSFTTGSAVHILRD